MTQQLFFTVERQPRQILLIPSLLVRRNRGRDIGTRHEKQWITRLYVRSIVHQNASDGTTYLCDCLRRVIRVPIHRTGSLNVDPPRRTPHRANVQVRTLLFRHGKKTWLNAIGSRSPDHFQLPFGRHNPRGKESS